MSEDARRAHLTRLGRLRALAVSCLLALVALGLAWELWLAPTGRGSWALKVLPLAFALPGVLRHRMLTYRWLSLLLWLYVAESAVRALSEGTMVRALALGQLALALLLFTTCVMHVRWRLASTREAAR
ncbi:MAG TPA: DUF2069 domain-containing protein [Burkholderiaceae bacterium]|nr:DUF2069 domain-containing protein [Burkholderiaceae bacterium]